MKRSWLIILAWLLLLVPTLFAGYFALQLLQHEQERIAASALAASGERAEAVVESLDLAIAEVKEGLEASLRSFSEQNLAERLEQWRLGNPLIRNVFIWSPERGLVFPDAAEPLSEEEQSFSRRFDALFKGRAAWQTPGGESRAAKELFSSRRQLRELSQQKARFAAEADMAAAPAAVVPPGESGWVPWFWEDQVSLFGWYQPAGAGLRFGVEVEMMALMGRLVSVLPAVPPADEAYALLDGNGRVFHQTGSFEITPQTPKLVALSTSPGLPHWQVVVYGAAQNLAEPGEGSFVLLASLVVGTFVVAILSGGSLLLWQAYRNMTEARRKTSFVSNVSHELKTPLTTIRMYAELLSEGRIEEPAKKERYLGVIVDESQRLTRLVNNVLDFSRLEQGRKTYRVETLELAGTLHGILDAQAMRLEKARVHLVRRIPDEPLQAEFDKDALEQTILNLIDNALKYAGDGKEIEVLLEERQGGCFIRVADRGPGVSESHRKRIFETFHRVDDSLTSRKPGSGLGLSIARQLLRDLGGDLVYQARQGGGACFEMRLPCRNGEG